MTDKASLLPPHLSELERDLDAALARIDDVDIPIATLWNPWECPIEALPYLAWSMSVDQWRSNWSEHIKRQVVANSLAVHRRKGTRPAVEVAINSVFDNCQLREWFEQEPIAQRGTFVVDAHVTDSGIDESTVKTLYQSIDNANRKSAHYTLRVILSSSSQSFISAGTISAVLATVSPYVLSELNSLASAPFLLGSLSSLFTTIEAR